ncbi:protein TonB [Hymenobacter gelipurpurascens]|uniref:Protein TonB n=1 Tax=Hymenobacter gelipurpurascens TaxID=89968 RepID=A0A212U912_9BACT|nr:energy transducer TonB [Hymenobacter gelipurpurascens]SNC74762.1 protein TonB [Hymenobacter gelipurpurascens]
MKSFYIVLLAVLLFSLPTQAQKNPSKPVKFKKGQAEQGLTSADGRRIGKWNFYGLHDELEMIFDYDSSRITYVQPDTSRYLVRIGDQWELKHMTRTPKILGSNKQRTMDIATKLRYPANALRQGQQGSVVLAYTVDTDGHTKDYLFEKSAGSELDQEVWRVVKELPDNWVPAVYQGQLAPTKFYIVVHFKIVTAADAMNKEQQPVVSPLLAPKGNHYVNEIVTTGRIGVVTQIR